MPSPASRPARPCRESVTVSGTLEGKTFARSLPVKDVAANAGYLPRTWARLEIDRLLAENAVANKARIVQLSMASYVMTPFTSLLVLENEQMYAQFGVDRGRKDHWAMYPCPATIPVLPPEPMDGQGPVVQAPAPVKRTAEQVLQTILVHVPPRALGEPGAGAVATAITAGDLYAGGFGVPVAPLYDGIGKDRAFSFWMGFDGPAPRTPDVSRPGQELPKEETGTKPPALVTSKPASGAGGFPARPRSAAGRAGPGLPTTMPAGGGGGGGMGGPGMGNGALRGGMGMGGGFGGLAGLGGMGGSSNGFGNFPGGGGFSFSGGYSFGGGASFTGGGSFAGSSGSGSGYPGPLLGGKPGPQAPLATALTGTSATTYSAPAQGWLATGVPGNNNLYYNYFPFYRVTPPAGSPRAALDAPTYELRQRLQGEDKADALRLLELGREVTARDQLLKDFDYQRLATDDEAKLKGRLKDPLKGDLLDGAYFKKARDGGKDLSRLGEQLEALQDAAERSARAGPGSLLYRRPTFAPDGRHFTDLVAFAPGLNTSQADILGVLETEALADPGDAPGTIEPAARALIEGARATGWRTLSIPAAGGVPAWSVAFDGSGRYAIERVLSRASRNTSFATARSCCTSIPNWASAAGAG